MVEHDVLPSRKDPAKTVTFCRLTDKAPASGFDKDEAEIPAPPSKFKSTPANPDAGSLKNTKIDLDDLLG
jgi:hypothetical protein